MATSRVVGSCLLGSVSCSLRGTLFEVPFAGGGSCPSVLPPIRFEWSKGVSALTSGEQSSVSAARTVLQGKVNAEEACTDLRAVNYFDMTLGAGGTVQNVTAWLDGPTVGGRQRQIWSRWSKARSAFTSGEQSQLDGLVSVLSGYLATEEPIP